MPPLHVSGSTAQLGWKAFFACLAIMQMIALGVMWRTYDAVTTTSARVQLHDYQIREEIKPAIKELQSARPR